METNTVKKHIGLLFNVRNKFGSEFSEWKLSLLKKLCNEKITGRKNIITYYDSLLFLLAYPDNEYVFQSATLALRKLESDIHSSQNTKTVLFNSGVTGTEASAAFSFEIVKWLHQKFPSVISLNNIVADEYRMQSILSVVMPKVESEILQDANADWKSWFNVTHHTSELLGKLISVFDQTDIRPEVKDELWNTLEINVLINFLLHTCLPESLITRYYHQSIEKKISINNRKNKKPVKVSLTENEAEHIIDCGRIILLRHLKEIDPVTFTSPNLVSYYKLERGVSVALLGMIPERRHPNDCYIGYVAFKNGLPVAYAGSWILFDSARIGLNVFPSYRGGESQYIFQQVINLHKEVYNLNRISADPYQIGKHNDDGIKSGAFWLYYHLGFRPVKAEQKKIAEEEAKKIKTIIGYRSSSAILKKLAESKLEIVFDKKAVRFDAADLSLIYAAIIKKNFNGDRKIAEQYSFPKLVRILKIKNQHDENLKFILKNWCVILIASEKKLRSTPKLITTLKKVFELKADGSEEEFISALQQSKEFRRFMEGVVEEYKI